MTLSYFLSWWIISYLFCRPIIIGYDWSLSTRNITRKQWECWNGEKKNNTDEKEKRKQNSRDGWGPDDLLHDRYASIKIGVFIDNTVPTCLLYLLRFAPSRLDTSPWLPIPDRIWIHQGGISQREGGEREGGGGFLFFFYVVVSEPSRTRGLIATESKWNKSVVKSSQSWRKTRIGQRGKGKEKKMFEMRARELVVERVPQRFCDYAQESGGQRTSPRQRLPFSLFSDSHWSFKNSFFSAGADTRATELSLAGGLSFLIFLSIFSPSRRLSSFSTQHRRLDNHRVVPFGRHHLLWGVCALVWIANGWHKPQVFSLFQWKRKKTNW